MTVNHSDNFSSIEITTSSSYNGYSPIMTENENENEQYDLDYADTMDVPLLEKCDDENAENGNAYKVVAICKCEQAGFGANTQCPSAQDAKLKIIFAISLCCIFMIVEFLGGYFAGSLAIMTDAAHLATDCISFIIGLLAIWIARKPPDNFMSFGYKRIEVIGAVISISAIWILTAILVLLAIQRLYWNDFDIDANTMMQISAIGILINIAMAFILHGSCFVASDSHHSHSHSHSHSHEDIKDKQTNDENLNLRAALVHVIGDLVQSVGVFIASIVIKLFPQAKIADPLCTLLFSTIVIMTTTGVFKDSMAILFDSVPTNISLSSLEKDLSNIDGVKSVHHLNVWNHTANHGVMMVHLVADKNVLGNELLLDATNVVKSSKYNIKHSTIQIEYSES